ncbi:MAG: hypothetical protein BGO49_02475 [Planctomycetales bacterium 71-10]|nr:MAG: hypothetical protein BGO49_02475 [Planctomycetales bacterium 71-10]
MFRTTSSTSVTRRPVQSWSASTVALSRNPAVAARRSRPPRKPIAAPSGSITTTFSMMLTRSASPPAETSRAMLRNGIRLRRSSMG